MSGALHEHHRPEGRGRWVFWAFLGIAAFFLATEHRAHLYQYLPFLLLLACPLLHLFYGHGKHGGDRKTGGDENQ